MSTPTGETPKLDERQQRGAVPDPTAPGTEVVTPSEPLAAKLRRAATSTSGSMPIFLALIGIIVIFAIMKPSAFLGSYNIKSIFIDASVALTLSVGMTYVIITAGIDLSVGSVLVFSGVIALKVMAALAGGYTASANAGWGIILVGIAAGLAVGLGWGVLNGVLIAKLDLPPLIVTLGSFGAALGLADVLTGGVDLSGVPNKLANSIGAGNVGPIPVLVLIAAIVAISRPSPTWRRSPSRRPPTWWPSRPSTRTPTCWRRPRSASSAVLRKGTARARRPGSPTPWRTSTARPRPSAPSPRSPASAAGSWWR